VRVSRPGLGACLLAFAVPASAPAQGPPPVEPDSAAIASPASVPDSAAVLAERALAERALPVTRVHLDNGMRFLLLPRPGAPTVAFVVRFGVGGVDDPPGGSGMAHLLEHLLFTGSSSIGTSAWAAERFYLERIDAVADSLAGGVPAEAPALAVRLAALEDSARTFVVTNEFAEILTRNGGRCLNATTEADATTYYVELPSNRAELWFALEADRMADPVFREFHAERAVVLEERRLRVEDRPDGRLEEALLAETFRVHPYGVPVVGSEEDLRALTRAQVTAYHGRYYGPSNAVVAIVGDVDPARMETLAKRYFAALPAGQEPPPVAAVEPPQRAPRRVHVALDAEPRLRMSWHTVAAGHPDALALAVLASVLTGGVTSRLYRRLVVEERSAVDVFAGGGPGNRYPGLLTISATPRAPATTAELEAAVLEEIVRIATEPPSERELTAVRNAIAMGEVERLTSNLGLALQLAESETLFGDWRRTLEAPRELRSVTAADVSRVARAYLRPDAVTVATLGRGSAAGSGTDRGGR
jgi:predicted Zn-dependent peptidase